MLIFIRHAEKAYQNCHGDSGDHRHDPPLTDSGYIFSKDKSFNLVGLYGEPDLIVSGPYERCRKTAEAMAQGLSRKVDIKVDPDLSEYLGNHKNDDLDVTEETLKYNPPHPETFDQFLKRVNKIYDKYCVSGRKEIVWIITHGIILSRLYKIINRRSRGKFEYLEDLTI